MATIAPVIQNNSIVSTDDANHNPDTSRKPNSRPPVDPHPPTINRPEHLQDTVDCINLHPVDEENELQKYLSGLPDDDVFEAMNLTEIGVARAHTISRHKSSLLDDPSSKS